MHIHMHKRSSRCGALIDVRVRQEAPIDRAKLRERLQGMSNKVLREFGKACEHMCSSKANFGRLPREEFVIQLEEARP